MNTENNKKANKLINERSPYLLQHAHNPVDWYPWSNEAFEKAERENKPVFLSIGYSTCHWCHVMEHESFEDSTVAELMNDVFVSIKVDREERPDIDNIYMTVCQMMTGHGGWPLSIVMTPDKQPFFAGTYFPKESRHGRIGFIDLIKRIDEAWKLKREEIESSAANITKTLQEYNNTSSSAIELSAGDLDKTYKIFESRFDSVYGGFGDSPKFPSPHNLTFLLRYWKRTGDSNALKMVSKTLIEMRKGGIFDHVGKGFHRYSTDKFWLLPHFEKMIYDQAMLAIAYLETFQATKQKFFVDSAEEILEYVLRDMTDRDGGFYSAEDADSEGEEGKFYVWTEQEIRSILSTEDAELYLYSYNFREEGNYIDETTRESTGANIPHLKKEFNELCTKFGLPENEFRKKIESIRQILFNEREKRVHPLKDDKVLTDWNGLMISALAIAGRILNNDMYTKAAIKSVGFIHAHLTGEDGSLLHRYRDGASELNGYLDDYAFLIWGLLELYETTFEPEYLKNALSLQEKQLELFWDEINSGFFLTPDNGEMLLVRSKEIYDGAIPSGNSVSYLNLIKLNKITANTRYQDYADKLNNAFSEKVKNSLSGSTMFLSGFDFDLGPSSEIIIAGDNEEDKQSEMVRIFREQFIPNKVILFVGADDKYDLIKNIAEYTNSYKYINNRVTVYVCNNYECTLPAVTKDEVIKILK